MQIQVKKMQLPWSNLRDILWEKCKHSGWSWSSTDLVNLAMAKYEGVSKFNNWQHHPFSDYFSVWICISLLLSIVALKNKNETWRDWRIIPRASHRIDRNIVNIVVQFNWRTHAMRSNTKIQNPYLSLSLVASYKY